jgi:nucleoside phosphorylase
MLEIQVGPAVAVDMEQAAVPADMGRAVVDMEQADMAAAAHKVAVASLVGLVRTATGRWVD